MFFCKADTKTIWKNQNTQITDWINCWFCSKTCTREWNLSYWKAIHVYEMYCSISFEKMKSQNMETLRNKNKSGYQTGTKLEN